MASSRDYSAAELRHAAAERSRARANQPEQRALRANVIAVSGDEQAGAKQKLRGIGHVIGSGLIAGVIAAFQPIAPSVSLAIGEWAFVRGLVRRDQTASGRRPQDEAREREDQALVAQGLAHFAQREARDSAAASRQNVPNGGLSQEIQGPTVG